jgi:hypothetical protein
VCVHVYIGSIVILAGIGLKCFICQNEKVQDVEILRNQSGSYISYLNFGFCKDGNEVGNLEECRYDNHLITSELQHEDVTPFCGYYIVGGLDKSKFYDPNSGIIDIKKINVFKKLFGGIIDKDTIQKDDRIHSQIIKNRLRDLPFFHKNNGVIRGCFGSRKFNSSAGEAQRGPGCHDIWRLVCIVILGFSNYLSIKKISASAKPEV